MSFIPFTDENEKQNWNLFDFRSDPRSGSADSDPYHNEADPKHLLFIKKYCILILVDFNANFPRFFLLHNYLI